MATLREQVNDFAARVAQEFNTIRKEIGSGEIGGSGPCTAQGTSYGNYGYETVGDALDSILYVPISISSFSNNVGTVEIGTTIREVTFSQKTNKIPTKITLDLTNIDPSVTSYVKSGLALTSNTSFTLKVEDEKGTSISKATSVNFLNGLYWGVGSNTEITNEFIRGLSKVLTSSRVKTFTVNPGSGEYIWYCIPSRFGNPTFLVGGFEGGFDLVTTFDFTNSSGYKESYDIYRSTNSGLGSTDVTVK